MGLAVVDLVNALTIANESERSVRQQQAEQQLKVWETEPGYHFLLQDIYLNTELPLQVRWLAIICFKNGVEKYWRSSRQNSISREEKSQIKSRIFDLLKEKNNQLSIQNAHSIARIVRFDFPSEWPLLFDDIAKNLEEFVFNENDLVSTNNLLIILNQVIKSVSMVRIGRARHAMQSKAPIIVPVLLKLYIKFFQAWTSSLDLTLMEVCYLCLKNLRRIIPEGFEQPHKNHDIVEFLKLTVAHLQGLIMEHGKYSSDLLERYVKSYSKLYATLINTNPTSFILLPCSSDIMSTFLSLLEQKAENIYNSTEENDFWEVLAIKGFTILKRLITYIYRKGAITLKQRNDRDEVNNAINKLSNEFFTPAVVQHLCDLIINWYLRLRPSDLESWLLEPEEWCNEELSTSWEYQVRPCAENFYQDLIHFFKDLLSDFILNKISNGVMNNNSVNDILVKDATLCTFQLSATSIANNVDFNRLLGEVFIPEGLKNDQVENKIIKRRICLVINEWVSIDCSRESRVEIYRLLFNFLQPDNKINDKVVKLTTIQTLRTVVDDWDFNKQDFQPFLNDFISLSISTLQEMEFTESKLYILNTLAVLIERCNPLIDHQTLMSILAIVPNHWNNTSQHSEDNILKTSLLRILKNLVAALNEHSPETYSITLPLIRNCVTENAEFYTLLSEDGYELWLATLQYLPVTKIHEQELMELFDLVQPGLINSTEILPVILSILRSYSFISPSLFTTEVGSAIFRTLSGYLSNMRDDAFAIFIAMMDILFLQLCNDELLVKNLINSGLFNEMINYVLDENQSIVSANKILLVISRLPFKSSEVFFRILSHLSIDSVKFLETWLQYYKSNGNPRNKKINLLAFLSMAEYAVINNYPVLPAKFGEICQNTFLFLEEVNEDVHGSCSAYSQNLAYEDIDDYKYLDHDIKPHGEKKRYQSLLDTDDPLFKVNLKEYLREIILKFKNHLSPADFNGFMGLNNQYTNEKLQQLLS